MTSPFQACLAETLFWEGGFSDDPFDRGGPTNKGITLAVFASWRRLTVTPETLDIVVAQLRAISDGEVAAIYRAQYWDQVRGDELPPTLALAVFDFGVNSGPMRAVRHLQAVLGVNVDGHMGAVTLGAAAAADPLATALALNQRRRAFLRQIDVFWKFGRGWLRRVDGIDRACRQTAGAVHVLPRPPAGWSTEVTGPHADPDAQSATQARATLPDVPQVNAAAPARAAEAAGGVGGVQLGVDVSGAAAAAQAGGKTFSLVTFVLELAQRPSFWLALAAIGGSAYVWLAHRRQQATL